MNQTIFNKVIFNYKHPRYCQVIVRSSFISWLVVHPTDEDLTEPVMRRNIGMEWIYDYKNVNAGD
jgi:hypothetical protein